MQRTLIYFLFVIVVVYFLALRYQKMETVVLWQGQVRAVSGKVWGEAEGKRRSDGSEYIVLRLKQKVPEAVIVIVEERDHTGREIGRFDGASFIMTLPPGLKAENIAKIKLVSLRNGRVLAEVEVSKASASP